MKLWNLKNCDATIEKGNDHSDGTLLNSNSEKNYNINSETIQGGWYSP